MKWAKRLSAGVLCLLLLLTAGCAQSGAGSGSGGGAGSGTGQPQTGTVAETKVDEYLAMAEVSRKNGAYFTERLLEASADFWYGYAGAALSSLRLCAERILWLRGEGENFAALSQGSRYVTWDEIGDMCWGSPFPLYFEGLLLEVQGKKEEAAERYAWCSAMPSFPDDGVNFAYLRDMEIADLYALRDRLRGLEEQLYTEWEPTPSGVQRELYLGFPEYLQRLLVDMDDAEKYAEALPYCRQLVGMAPFAGENWALAVTLAMEAGEPFQATLWLMEGQTYCPESTDLKGLAQAMDGVESALGGDNG